MPKLIFVFRKFANAPKNDNGDDDNDEYEVVSSNNLCPALNGL